MPSYSNSDKYTVTTVAGRPTFGDSFLGNFCVTFVPAFPVRFPVNQDRAFIGCCRFSSLSIKTQGLIQCASRKFDPELSLICGHMTEGPLIQLAVRMEVRCSQTLLRQFFGTCTSEGRPSEQGFSLCKDSEWESQEAAEGKAL